MYNRNFIILVSLLVEVAYTDVVLPTLPPLIQQFARIQSCTMTVYSELPPTTIQVFRKGMFHPVSVPRGGEQTYCCEGWEDAEGAFEGTAVCSKQQANGTPYITAEEYNDILSKVAEIRSAYEYFKALKTATALAEKARALIFRVSEQHKKITRLQSILSHINGA